MGLLSTLNILQANGYVCHVCREDCASRYQERSVENWLDHVLGIRHSEMCLAEVQELGIENYNNWLGFVPGPLPGRIREMSMLGTRSILEIFKALDKHDPTMI